MFFVIVYSRIGHACLRRMVRDCLGTLCLRRIRNDFAALCLQNLLIVEPNNFVIAPNPTHHFNTIKNAPLGHFLFVADGEGLSWHFVPALQPWRFWCVTLPKSTCFRTLRCWRNFYRVRFLALSMRKNKSPKGDWFLWCGQRESNPRLKLGKLSFCHYTMPA